MFLKTFITRTKLIELGWEMFTKYGWNCEIWRKDGELLLWNRVTLKVYFY